MDGWIYHLQSFLFLSRNNIAILFNLEIFHLLYPLSYNHFILVRVTVPEATQGMLGVRREYASHGTPSLDHRTKHKHSHSHSHLGKIYQSQSTYWFVC